VIPRTRFARLLALVAAAGLGLRLAYVLIAARDIPVVGDALTFHLVGDRIAAGEGFFRPPDPLLPSPLGTGPTAEHPPLFELLLGALDLVGLDGLTAQKLALCFVGTATVVLIGVAGRVVAGDRTGLIAAMLAAAYPFLWLADGALMSETLYGALVAGVLVTALLFARAPSVRLALALGALIGLAALTRGEGILLVPLLALPLALRTPARWRLTAATLAATAVVLAPWFIRNAVVFEEPVLISTNGNAVFVGANCEPSYHGRFVGLWQLPCYGVRPPGDESEKAAEYRNRGLDYARDHAGRVPVVVAARVGRVWDFFRPVEHQNYGYFEGRSRVAGKIGLGFYYPLLALAIVGAIVLRRRRDAPLYPLLALPLLVTVTAALVYGFTRFRFAAEPALVVLAAVALDAVLRRRGRRPPGQASDRAALARA
jgi:4-amino-4-deoxy-L-arabinose transferase-like glycosyltransferase